MTPKEKIIRILEENCVNFIYSDDESFNIDGVDKDNFNEVAKQIAEKLTSTDVSQKRELLIDFAEKVYRRIYFTWNKKTSEKVVDEYIKGNL